MKSPFSNCQICDRLLNCPSDELSMDCGGDCWGCVGEVEARMGNAGSLDRVRDEAQRGLRPQWNEQSERLELLRTNVTLHRDCLKLRALIVELLNQGADRDALFSDLEELRAAFRIADDEKAEDAVTDVMDSFVGFCAPHMRL